MWKMSRFSSSFFFFVSFSLSSFSPSVIHYIPKQHQNSHRPFSSEISKRNVIACKASTFLPSTFLLWEVCLSWLFLVSDSFFFPSFFLFYYYALTTHCLTVLIINTYLYNSRPNPRHLSRYRRRNLRARLCSDIGCSWLDLSFILSSFHPLSPSPSLPYSLIIPLPKKKEKKKANTIQPFLLCFTTTGTECEIIRLVEQVLKLSHRPLEVKCGADCF